jgi:hypothetical protein
VGWPHRSFGYRMDWFVRLKRYIACLGNNVLVDKTGYLKMDRLL